MTGDGREEIHARGMETRRAVLGDAHVDRAIEGTTPFTEAFQNLITPFAWAEIWSRPGLDRRTRSCITLTALVAMGRGRAQDARSRGAPKRPSRRTRSARCCCSPPSTAVFPPRTARSRSRSACSQKDPEAGG